MMCIAAHSRCDSHDTRGVSGDGRAECKDARGLEINTIDCSMIPQSLQSFDRVPVAFSGGARASSWPQSWFQSACCPHTP